MSQRTIDVSELSWKHVEHPGSVVAVGDDVIVRVLDVDLNRERIDLSLNATQQDPWQVLERHAQARGARVRSCHDARSALAR